MMEAASHTLQIEQMLKKIYSVHKDYVKVTQNVSSQRTAANKRLEEKVEALQKENDELLLENKKLHGLVANGNTRGGNCCEAIRQSLESVINTYQKLVSERDAKIKQLERDLLKRQTASVPCTESELSMRETGVTLTQEDLPDSTCSTTPKSSRKTSQVGSGSIPGTETKSQALNKVAADSGKHGRVSTQLKSTDMALSESHTGDSQNDCTSKEDTSLQLPNTEVSPSEGLKLKLQKTDKKRKRYSEETFPDVKRTKCSTVLDTETSTSDVNDKSKVPNLSTKDENEITKKHEICNSNKGKAGVNENEDHRRNESGNKVLVSETMGVNSEADVDEVAAKQEKSGRRKHKEKRNIVEDTILCVPETMAVEYDSDEEDILQGYKPDLSKITEVTEASIQASSGSAKKGETGIKLATSTEGGDDRMEVMMKVEMKDEEEEEDEKIEDNDSLNVSAALKLIDASDVSEQGNGKDEGPQLEYVKGNTELRKDKNDKHVESQANTEFSLRSVLASPDCDEHDQSIKYNSKLLKNEKIVKRSPKRQSSLPSENDTDSIVIASQKFGKKIKNQQLSKTVRNSCKNMQEVNALFETPAKGDKILESESDVLVTRSFNKVVNISLTSLSENEEVVLRRSPRKHKSSLVQDKVKSLKASSKELSYGDTKGDTVKDMLGDDHDETLAPEGHESVAVSDVNESTCLDNQSVDFYNIVPVKNGVLNNSRTFQFKARRLENCGSIENVVCAVDHPMKGSGRHCRESEKKVEHKLKQNSDETLKSPSLLHSSSLVRKNIPVDENEAIMLSSQSSDDLLRSLNARSVESVSDSESPLLLRSTKQNSSIRSNHSRNKEKWTSEGSKVKQSSKVSSRSSQSEQDQNPSKNKTGSKSKMYAMTLDSEKSCNNKNSKNLHQTTLTQAFFSPTKNKKAKEMDEKNVQLALKLSLAECKDKGLITITDDVELEEAEVKAVSPFKKPGPRKEGISRKKKHTSNNHLHTQDATNTETSRNNETRRHVLHEINGDSRDRNGMGSGNDVGRERFCGKNLNGSLDPEAELSQLCKGPETLPSFDTDFCSEDLAHGSQSLPRTSTLAADTQEIPCSSTSVKFPARRKSHKKVQDVRVDAENIAPHPAPLRQLDDSFDRPKKKSEDDAVAHVAVVRKRDERQKLHGHDCKQCAEYYKAAGLCEKDVKHHMNKCSRHRAKFVPPDTPPHFWSVDFIDTQDCPETERTEDGPAMPSHRRRHRLNKYFRGKNENSTIPAEASQDLDFG